MAGGDSCIEGCAAPLFVTYPRANARPRTHDAPTGGTGLIEGVEGARRRRGVRQGNYPDRDLYLRRGIEIGSDDLASTSEIAENASGVTGRIAGRASLHPST